MSNPFDMILEEFKARNAADYNKYPPFFIASIGAHYFNMLNQQINIYTEAGMTVNTRLHIIFVAPQGQQKSFWLKQFLEHDTSIIKNTLIKTDFEMKMSEAGYMGTVKFGVKSDTVVRSAGLCEEESNSIVGIEEFSELITAASSQDYNIGLENELLTTLDSGLAIKRLAAGKIEYRTNLTLWTATQPARYNLTSGLGRRFLFIFNVPTEASMYDLKMRRREAGNIVLDTNNIFEIKKALNQRFDEITTNIRHVRFDKSFYEYMNMLNVVSYEEPLYERLALGYTLMKEEKIEGDFVISPDKKLKDMMKSEWGWRKKIKQGTEDSMVWTFLESATDLRHERCLEVFMDFGMALEDARKTLRTLQKRGLISIERGLIKIKNDQMNVITQESEQTQLEE